MNRFRFAALALTLPAAIALGSCAGFTKAIASPFGQGDVGLSLVEELVDQIERVHVEAEVAKVDVHEVLDALRAISAPDFAGDPHAAHARTATAVEDSYAQAARLTASVEEMEEAAESFFEQWQRELDAFVSAELRERSRARMAETRARYDAILSAVGPARGMVDSFNQRASDLTVFLSSDFNASSVSAIEADVRVLTDQAAELVARLDACLVAAQEYIASSALPGGTEEQPTEATSN